MGPLNFERALLWTRRLWRHAPAAALAVAIAAPHPARAGTPVPVTPPNLAGALAGAVGGDLSVSAHGSTRYSIRLSVPPGTAGLVPVLSLEYDSAAGSGMLGEGWSIGGLSSITRCGKTVVHDGLRRPVRLDAEDPYCLDGARLIRLSGTHGATAEYRTELDAFGRITSAGLRPAIGPARWRVWSKSGQLLTYGATADASVEAPGAEPILSWALSRIEDRSGNYVSYHYTEDTATGEHYLSQIRYTGNSVSGKSPYNAINFVYAARPDVWSGHVAGSKLQRLKRLEAIVAVINVDAAGSGGTAVRQWRLGYEPSPSSGRSLVRAISDCDGAGTTCLPETVFDWTRRNPADNAPGAGSGDWGGPGPIVLNSLSLVPTLAQLQTKVVAADVNGDGKTDLISSESSGPWRVCLSTGSRFECTEWAGPGQPLSAVTLGDFNGDGKTDVLVPPSSTGGAAGPATVCLANGTAFDCTASVLRGYGSNPNGYMAGDYNADGRDDVIVIPDYAPSDQVYLCLSTGAGFGDCTPYGNTLAFYVDPTLPPQVRQFRHIGDINGDGRPDIVTFISSDFASALPPGIIWSQGLSPSDAPGSGTGFFAVFPATTAGYSSGYGFTRSTGVFKPLQGYTKVADSNRDPYDAYADIHAASVVLEPTEKWQTHVCRFSGALGTTAFSCTTQEHAGLATQDLAQLVDIQDYDGDGKPDWMALGKYGQIRAAGTLDTLSAFSGAGNTAGLWLHGDFNGDGVVDTITYDGSRDSPTYQTWKVTLAGSGSYPDLLAKVTNGLGRVTEIDYRGSHAPEVYTPGSGTAYPVRDVHVASPLVAVVRADNGIGGWLQTQYRYEGRRADLLGRGSLGFERVTSVDMVNLITTTTTYSQSFPTIGMPLLVEAVQDNGVVLSRTVNTIAAFETIPKAFHVYVRQAQTSLRDLNGADIGTNTSLVGSTVGGTDGIDGYGNVTFRVDTAANADGSFRTETTHTYENRVDDWLFLERSKSVTAHAPDVASVTRLSTADYDSKGRLTQTVVEPDDPQLRLQTDLTPDPTYGVLTKRQLRWTDPRDASLVVRDVQTILEFDPHYRFARKVKNAKGHIEQRVHDEATGSVLELTDPNLLVTTWEVDPWGRKTRELRADASSSTWAYRRCVDACLNGAVAVTIAQNWQGAEQTTVPTETFLDRLGREVVTRSWDHVGWIAHAVTTYDAQGRLQSRTRVHYPGAPHGVQEREYDAIGRVRFIRTTKAWADGFDTTEIIYNGVERTTIDPRGHSRVERRAANGKIAQITNAKGQTTSYRSSAFGQLVRLTDPLGNTIDVTYDRLGRKKELRDPDLGTWQYRVDPLGQTYWQQDAKGQVTAFTHDELGRLTRQLEPDADSYWVYDSAANGIGKLDETYTLSGTGSKDFRRAHTYDALSRPARVVTSLDWDYAQEFAYDDYQRISTVSHRRSARGGTTGPVNTFTYDYNTFGFEERIGRLMSDGSKRSMLYTSSRDAQGRLTVGFLGVGVNHWRGYNDHTGRIQEIYTGVQWNDLVPGRTGARNGARNGLLEYIQTDTYYYDGVGNLEQRTQLSDGPGTEFSDVYETFTYDELDRLQSATVHNYNATTDYNYDAIGNLSVNAGKLYTYPPSGAGSVRPHAVSSITGTVGGVVDPVFTYDDNGNLLSGVNRSYAWTASNHAKHIDRWSAGAAVQRTEFVLGSAKERVQQTVRAISGGVPGAAQRVIYYAGAIEKEIDFQAGKTRIRTYMPQGLGFVQEELEGTAVTPDSAVAVDSRQERLYLRDHLGSVSGVFDGETGVSLQFLRYDPWGRRRNADGTEDADPELGALRNEHDRRGFTGQEHLEELGLVHLNGRIYDPITARMVSADPTVPDAYDLQAVNRYGYVLNNPLAYTDPTGFEPACPPGGVCIAGERLKPDTAQLRETQSREGGFPYTSFSLVKERVSVPGSRIPVTRTFAAFHDGTGRQFLVMPYEDLVEAGDKDSEGLGLQAKIQEWIDSGVAGADYSLVARLLGAVGTGLNVMFIPDSRGELIMVVFPPARLGGVAFKLAARTTKAANRLAGVPGRVGSRINLSNEGMEHVIARHLSGKANASQFSLSEAELRSVLSSRAAVSSPVVRSVESADGIRYVREFDAGRVIGADKFNGNQATSVMTIMTDRFGNLVSTFPGLLK